jgi:hypothetical protein
VQTPPTPMRMTLSDEHTTFMNESRRHHESLKRNGTVKGCNLPGMMIVMKAYWEPDLHLDMSDADDIVAFIHRLYLRYDEYLRTIPKSPEPVEVVESTPPTPVRKPRKSRKK